VPVSAPAWKAEVPIGYYSRMLRITPVKKNTLFIAFIMKGGAASPLY
jgi:hypothetical protein